jgi:hypothetical protein
VEIRQWGSSDISAEDHLVPDKFDLFPGSWAGLGFDSHNGETSCDLEGHVNGSK